MLDRPFEAYRGDEPYVFICYAHDDQAVVYPEINRDRRDHERSFEHNPLWNVDVNRIAAGRLHG